MDATNKEEVKFCHGCRKPQRRTQADALIPLKRCARCHQAWYHSLECQKQHYPTHKKECHTWVNRVVDSASRQEISTSREKVRVQASTGRGNCLVASDLIRRGERIYPQVGGGGTALASWNGLVAPVLLESQRWTRCALCFGKLGNPPLRYGENPWRGNQHPYALFFCSRECQRNGKDHGLDREEAAVLRLYQGSRGPSKIFATAILLYRLLNAGADVINELTRLQCQLPDGKSETDESEHHSQAVMATVLAMTRISSDVDLQGMTNRIKINGFSIADGESIALGIGVYSLPSFMNHSCQPNVIQTFLHGHDHQPPTLFLTAYQDIPAGQEIMISYLDNSSPRHIRRRRLLEDYFFLCDCSACRDTKRESCILAARCRSCQDSARPLQVVDRVAPFSWSLTCSICSADDTDMVVPQEFTSLELPADTSVNLSTLKESFNKMNGLCFPGSWYVQESGDRLAHAFLDKLGQSDTIDEQEKNAIEALNVLNYLVDDSVAKDEKWGWSSTSLELRRAIQLFQSAKLRLYLYPDPTSAIQMLDRAYAVLSAYYPSGHETIKDLKVTMESARM